MSVASVSVAWAVMIAGSNREVQWLLKLLQVVISDLVIRSPRGSICRVPVSCQMLLDSVHLSSFSESTSRFVCTSGTGIVCGRGCDSGQVIPLL